MLLIRKDIPCGGSGFPLLVSEQSRRGTWHRGRAFAHGAMGCRINPSWGGPIELFLVPASAPQLV